MSLEARRLIKWLVENVLPRYEEELRELTGASIAYDVAWPTFADNLDALQGLEGRGLIPISFGIRTICQDELGRDAVRETITKILLTNVQDTDTGRIVLHDGIADVQYNWTAGGHLHWELVNAQLTHLL